MKEGVIQYSATASSTEPVSHEKISELIQLRDALHSLELIGVNEGIGYGNLGIRLPGDEILITASGTGGKSTLTEVDFSIVESVDLTRFSLQYRGVQPPSSEAVTYYSVFLASKEIEAMLHIHSEPLYEYFKETYGVMLPDVDFGSSELSQILSNSIQSGHLDSAHDIFALDLHRGGIYVYSTSIRSCQDMLYDLMEEATDQREWFEEE